jgi:hypothetical protein
LPSPVWSAPPSSTPYRIDLHAHFLQAEYRGSLLANGYTTISGYPTPQWSGLASALTST